MDYSSLRVFSIFSYLLSANIQIKEQENKVKFYVKYCFSYCYIL